MSIPTRARTLRSVPASKTLSRSGWKRERVINSGMTDVIVALAKLQAKHWRELQTARRKAKKNFL